MFVYIKARYLFETIVKFSAKLSRIYCLSGSPRFVPPRPVTAKPNYGAIRVELSSLARRFSMVSVSSSLLSLFIVVASDRLLSLPLPSCPLKLALPDPAACAFSSPNYFLLVPSPLDRLFPLLPLATPSPLPSRHPATCRTQKVSGIEFELRESRRRRQSVSRFSSGVTHSERRSLPERVA
jgi:hypothetical protein